MSLSDSPSEEEIFTRIKTALVQMFELDAERVTREASLQNDLDIDSIDVIDLLVKLEEELGRDIASRDFTAIRNVGDISTVLHHALKAKKEGV